MVEVLKLAGDDLSRENIRSQAEKLMNLRLPMMLPGIVLGTSSSNHLPVQKLYLMKFMTRLGRFLETRGIDSLPSRGAVRMDDLSNMIEGGVYPRGLKEKALKSAAPLLSIQRLCLRFGGIVALRDVSFDVADGQICGLIGPNGAGKSSLFNCISQLSPGVWRRFA